MVDQTFEADFEAYEDLLRYAVHFARRSEPDAELFFDLFTDFVTVAPPEFFRNMHFGDEEARRFARALAMQVWNALPLPSNRYRPRPIAMPKRNDPCLCGSGTKFKYCCKEVMDHLPPVSEAIITGILLEQVTQAELKQAYLHVPHELLAYVANQWGKNGDARMAERALMLLDPIFKQEDRKLDYRDEMAMEVLIDLCVQLDKPRKKTSLIKRMITHPDRALRVAAMQRYACVLSDQGKHAEAWSCFQQAQRIDPDDPSLGYLELLLLMQQGKREQMRQRGQFWLKRLQGMNRDGELNAIIEMIERMIADEHGGLLPIMERSAPEVARLLAWLRQAEKSPPPLLEKIRCQDDYCAITPKDEPGARLLRQWDELMWRHEEDMWARPGPWLDMLEDNPQLAGSIRVLDGLIQAVYQLEGEGGAVFEQLVAVAALLAKMLVPQQPKKPMIWHVMDNRPALRVMAFLADSMDSMGDKQSAVRLREQLLRLNPPDNQGNRGMLINDYLQLGRNEDAVDLCRRYPDDIDVNIAYGCALALFRLGRKREAGEYLRQAIEDTPLVVDALLRKHMRKPKNLDPGYVTFGGEDEAWYYRQDARSLWVDTPGALAWLKQVAKQAR